MPDTRSTPLPSNLWGLLHTYGLTGDMAWDEAKVIYDALLEADQQEVTLAGMRKEFHANEQRAAHTRRAVAGLADEDWVTVEPMDHAMVACVAEVAKAPLRTLKLYHGTSWDAAQSIKREGFMLSSHGCLGMGIYVGHLSKALRFAQDGARHGGPEGGLVECLVHFRTPKFVSSDDQTWHDMGFDACRADHTSASTHMEWCLKDPSQLEVLRVFRVPVASSAPVVVGVRAIPIRTRREQNTRDVKDSAVAFGRMLAQNLEARMRCEDKAVFKTEFAGWKERELAEGRVHRGSPSSVLRKLSQLGDECKALGCIRCNVVGSVIHFSNPNGKNLAGAAQRVHESRSKVEANKFGIVITPLSRELFAENAVVEQGERLRRHLTVRNTAQQACQLSARLLNRMSGAHGFSCPSLPQGCSRMVAPGEGACPSTCLSPCALAASASRALPPVATTHAGRPSVHFASAPPCLQRTKCQSSSARPAWA